MWVCTCTSAVRTHVLGDARVSGSPMLNASTVSSKHTKARTLGRMVVRSDIIESCETRPTKSLPRWSTSLYVIHLRNLIGVLNDHAALTAVGSTQIHIVTSALRQTNRKSCFCAKLAVRRLGMSQRDGNLGAETQC